MSLNYINKFLSKPEIVKTPSLFDGAMFEKEIISSRYKCI